MSSSHHGFHRAPTPSGWVQTGERWALWWNAREVAAVIPDGPPGVRPWLKGPKLWPPQDVRAARIRPGKRSAERRPPPRLSPPLPPA